MHQFGQLGGIVWFERQMDDLPSSRRHKDETGISALLFLIPAAHRDTFGNQKLPTIAPERDVKRMPAAGGGVGGALMRHLLAPLTTIRLLLFIFISYKTN